MQSILTLPKERVRQKADEVWAVVKGPDWHLSDQAYAHTLHNIRTFAARLTNEVLEESRLLRKRLKRLIILNRLLTAMIVVPIVGAILWSPWALIAVPIVLVLNVPVNRRQTATNIELAATIEVFLEMMSTDHDFRSEAIELVRRKNGDEMASRLADLCSILEGD